MRSSLTACASDHTRRMQAPRRPHFNRAGKRDRAEAPATVEDCQLGRGVSLKEGISPGRPFWTSRTWAAVPHPARNPAGGRGQRCSRRRAQADDPVALRHGRQPHQSVRLPHGRRTSRKNHSEIGSSYIHFNLLPTRTRLPLSLIGDVPGGVMHDQAPIFLGGQGGLVGPVRIAYGTVIPAGTIMRQDILDENQLYAAQPTPPRQHAHTP